MVKNVSTGSNPPKNNTAGELVTETIPEMQVTSSSDLKGLSEDQKETLTKLTLSGDIWLVEECCGVWIPPNRGVGNCTRTFTGCEYPRYQGMQGTSRSPYW